LAVTQNNLLAGGATVNLGAADRGAIKDGVTITPSAELLTLDLEQELTPSKAWRMGERFGVEFTLCEPTRENLKYAWDVDNAIGGAGPWTLNFGDHQFTPQTGVLIVTGKRPGATDGTRTITFLQAVLETPAPVMFSKRQETNLKCTFTALYAAGTYVGQLSDAA
jgi:hypothetical protein